MSIQMLSFLCGKIESTLYLSWSDLETLKFTSMQMLLSPIQFSSFKSYFGLEEGFLCLKLVWFCYMN